MARKKSPSRGSNQLTLDAPADVNVPSRTLVEEVEAAFLEYSMSVIVSRAARRARRPEARAPAHPLGDARREPAARPPVREVRACGRRRDGELPPARRLRDLRRARAHGSAVLAHRAARRQARKLRFAGRSTGREPLHGVPAVVARDGAARRDRRGHRRPGAELRRIALPARGAAGPVPQPPRERRAGHRGGHGHQHPAAQPRRGVQRGAEADRQARRHPGRPDAHREGPRLPDRRVHHGRRRHQGRVPHGSGDRPRARPPRDRADPARRAGDRAHRGPVPDERRRDRGQARRAGRVGQDRRRPRHPQRVGAGQDAARDRAAHRRQPPDRAQQPVQAHGGAEHVPGEHGRARRRCAAHDQPPRGVAGVARSPGRRRDAALAVPPREGAGAAAHRRRVDQGARRDRRRGQGDPRVGRPARRATR